MALPLKRLAQGALAALATVLYTVPVLKLAIIKSLTLTNTSGAPASAYVYLVPDGDAPAPANVLLFDVVVPARGFIDLAIVHALHPGDTIQAIGLGVTLTASGVEA